MLPPVSNVDVTPYAVCLCCTGGKAAQAGVAPLSPAVSSRLRSALSDDQQQQQQQQQQREVMLRDLERSVSVGRRFIVAHTACLLYTSDAADE